MRIAAVVLLAACASAPPKADPPPPKLVEMRDPRGNLLPFSKQHIFAGIEAVKPAVENCHDRHPQSGNVHLNFKIAPDGSVPEVHTFAGLVGTPLAGCIEAAMLAAKFPAFVGQVQTVGYPFRFR